MRAAISLAILAAACGSLVAAAPTASNSIASRSAPSSAWYSQTLKRGTGGSAASGSTGNANAGNIVNDGDTVNNQPNASKCLTPIHDHLSQTLMINLDVANPGGNTVTGNAVAGDGSGYDGYGGDASSGSAGSANGGSVYNYGGDITNDSGASRYPFSIEPSSPLIAFTLMQILLVQAETHSVVTLLVATLRAERFPSDLTKLFTT